MKITLSGTAFTGFTIDENIEFGLAGELLLHKLKQLCLQHDMIIAYRSFVDIKYNLVQDSDRILVVINK